jgi:hypothetical protein
MLRPASFDGNESHWRRKGIRSGLGILREPYTVPFSLMKRMRLAGRMSVQFSSM